MDRAIHLVGTSAVRGGWVDMKPHVLILEDNFLLAENLCEVVERHLDGEPVAVSTVSEALGKIPHNIDLAFLDIELADGKSYPAARKLKQNNIPFIFVSGNERASLPDDLKDMPFLSKPVPAGRLVRLYRALSRAFA
jgi:two-component SAPR family response regulator